MKRHDLNAMALKQPHDLDATLGQKWNFLREEHFTPAHSSLQCHGFGGAGLNVENGLTRMD